MAQQLASSFLASLQSVVLMEVTVHVSIPMALALLKLPSTPLRKGSRHYAGQVRRDGRQWGSIASDGTEEREKEQAMIV